jgi:hypothetical protein
MNSESEAIENFLAWLLQDPKSTITAPSGHSCSQFTELDHSITGVPQLHQLDPIDSEELNAMAINISDSNHFSFKETSLFKPGDIPAVQDRFHTLLKRRLRTEIERKPPLFPWETEVCDYKSEIADWVAPQFVPTNIWATQLQALNLPVPMPESLIAQLFDRCQEVVQSSLLEGAKLVRIVEDFFPGHLQALNQVTEWVLVSPIRGVESENGLKVVRPLPGFPSHYNVATQPQQMALSLIAAREILESLTLRLSPDQPKVERQWQTGIGLLTLQAESQSEPRHLRIQGQLPCSGALHLRAGEAQATAERSNPGYVSVELFDLQPNRVYPLEVRLAAVDQPPLVFAIHSAVEPTA